MQKRTNSPFTLTLCSPVPGWEMRFTCIDTSPTEPLDDWPGPAPKKEIERSLNEIQQREIKGGGGVEMPPSYSERSGQDGETASECRETEAGTVCPPKGRNLKLRVWERLEFCPVERWYRYSGGSFHLRQNKHRVWFKFQRQLPSTVGVDRKTNIGLVGMKLKTWKTVSENKPRHNC